MKNPSRRFLISNIRNAKEMGRAATWLVTLSRVSTRTYVDKKSTPHWVRTSNLRFRRQASENSISSTFPYKKRQHNRLLSPFQCVSCRIANSQRLTVFSKLSTAQDGNKTVPSRCSNSTMAGQFVTASRPVRHGDDRPVDRKSPSEAL